MVAETDGSDDYNARPIVGGKESRELAHAYAAAHPDDHAFLEYYDRFNDSSWKRHEQWNGQRDPHGDYFTAFVWTRVVDWHFVPRGYRPSKKATACFGKGGCCSGPGSRGSWYYVSEHTWTEPEEVRVAGKQLALFA